MNIRGVNVCEEKAFDAEINVRSCVYLYNWRERDIPQPIVTGLHSISRFAYEHFEFEIIIIFVPDKKKSTSRILMHPYDTMVITLKRLEFGFSAIKRQDNFGKRF